MNLRDLKKEVDSLQSTADNLAKFQQSWQIDRYLQHLPKEKKQLIEQRLAKMQKQVEELHHTAINQRLRQYARYLIELKLTTINGDSFKSKMITNRLVNDDFLRLNNTITDIESHNSNLCELNDQYLQINELLGEHLSLDENVSFAHLEHGKHLQTLMETSQQQKKLVKQLGTEFISLAKKTNGI